MRWSKKQNSRRARPRITIRDNLMKKAAELRLPVERQMITVDRQPRYTRIRVEYELSVEWLPGQEYW